jgi:GNAT superfamily N-acetyltransferase
MSVQWHVTKLRESQIEAAGEALARGFIADPLAVYMLPERSQRAQLLPWHFSAFVRYGHLFGEVFTTDQAEGAAVWLPPGDAQMTPDRIEQAGLHEAPLKLGAAWARFMSILEYLEPFHARDMPTAHWYLAVLGVDKPLQGQGLGSALLAPMLARADGEGLPCYLETVESTNVPFYQRHGFTM